MKSSWPVVIGFIAVAVAAVWYDARNEASAGQSPSPTNAAAMVSTR